MRTADVWRMIRRRVKQTAIRTKARLPQLPGHRDHLLPGGQGHAGKGPADGRHASPRTTKLYDRTNDQITLDEVEKIVI